VQNVASPLKLKFADDYTAQDATVEFAGGRDSQRTEVRLTIVKDADDPVIDMPVAIDKNLFKGEGNHIPERQVYLEVVEVNSTGEQLKIQLCIDPTGLDAGLYEGSITVDDSRLGIFEVPITVSLQFRPWVLPLLFGLVAAAVAAAAAVLNAALQDGLDWDLVRNNWGWLLVAAVSGAVVGIIVFLKTFEREKAWDGGGSAFLALALAAVTAGYTISILPTFGRALRKRDDQTEPKEGEEETGDASDPAVVIDDTDGATADAPEAADTGTAD
jgi:hypothetical protein